MNMFRELRADEIDCRIAQIKTKKDEATRKEVPTGLTLLLYKDARCDQNILDETVGPMNWMRQHSRDNANCTVLIWDADKGQWIGKEDTGTESNTEREKGLASDSFKRACFNWGIGRELYSAPFVWIKAQDCEIKDWGGKWKCFDNFTVADIKYQKGNIVLLKIKHSKTGKIVFNWTDAEAKPEEPDTEPAEEPVPIAKVKVEEQPKVPQMTETEAYLAECLKTMREVLQITKEENKKLFNARIKALIDAKLIENKSIKAYTKDELAEIFHLMYTKFLPQGTTLKETTNDGEA